MTRQERRAQAFEEAWRKWRLRTGEKPSMLRRERREAARDQAKVRVGAD